jgi:hypothetical protein
MSNEGQFMFHLDRRERYEFAVKFDWGSARRRVRD